MTDLEYDEKPGRPAYEKPWLKELWRAYLNELRGVRNHIWWHR